MASKTKRTEPLLQQPPASPNLFAGTSGWAYPTWKPGFYPDGLAASKFLSYYASRLNSVEVNYTFRTLPSTKQLEGWLTAVPPTFRFSFKAPQRITHFSRLRECEAHVAQFLRALEPARQADKLGLILFQLPPNFKCDLDRLHAFLSLPSLSAPGCPPIAFEFRHDSWFSPEIYERLTLSEAALCVAQSDDLDTPEVHSATKLACFRLRRNGGYTQPELDGFAARFTALAANRQVYAYFKHEDEPTGALNATAFLQASMQFWTA